VRLTDLNSDQLETGRTFPVVTCAGCEKPITPIVTESDDFLSITYHCERCAAETDRAHLRHVHFTE
jgi:hypothetical protein